MNNLLWISDKIRYFRSVFFFYFDRVVLKPFFKPIEFKNDHNHINHSIVTILGNFLVVNTLPIALLVADFPDII